MALKNHRYHTQAWTGNVFIAKLAKEKGGSYHSHIQQKLFSFVLSSRQNASQL